MAIGIFLLSLGIVFVVQTLQTNHFSLIAFLSNYVRDRQNATAIVLTAALFVGYLKGRYVLSKSAHRQILRILTLPNPANLKYIYSKGYYLLILSMILLGISLRFLPIALDVRGAVDIAIGSALINGAMIYFRKCITFTELTDK